MKRIISALLTVAMLVTLITVPMMVTADALETPGAWVNSSELFDKTAPMLYATKGTPTVDGNVDAIWKDAYTLRVDRSQNVIRENNKWVQSALIDVYMMWDENNLYILEERQYDKVVYREGKVNHYSQATASAYYVSVPATFTDNVTADDGAVYMLGAMAADTSAAAVGTPVQGVGTQRTKYYTGNSNATTFGDKAWAANANIVTYTTLTETGFLMETKIPWTEMQTYNPDFTAKKDALLGFSFQYNSFAGGSASNYNHKQIEDTYGFQSLTLVEENQTNVPAIPDFSWYTKDPSASVFYIEDEGDLLAWVEMTQRHGSSPLNTALSLGNYKFKGKKFVLTNDLEFNKGTTFNADGTWTGVAPVNGWGTIQNFAGEFDGQGHTISGLYAPIGYYKANDARYMGFVGRLGSGANIHDVSFTNGYFHNKDYNPSDTNKCGVGTIASVVHGGDGNGTITLKNIYSDITIVGSTDLCGGITGSSYSAANTNALTLENVVYAGTVVAGTGGGNAGLSARLEWSSNIKTTAKNCYAPIGAANSTATFTGDAAYVQSTDVADGKINVRLLGLIDETELDLDSVGMKVTVKYGEDTYTKELDGKTNVFATVNAAGTEIAVESLAGDYDYAYGVVLKGVPAGAEDTVEIDVVLTRVINGVEVQSACTYSATYKAGVLQSN